MPHSSEGNVLTWTGVLYRPRRSRPLPARGEKFFTVWTLRGGLFLRWRAHRGYIMCALLNPRVRGGEVAVRWTYGDERMPIKKRVAGEDLPPIPALSIESAILKKCPLVMEFCTATAYEDGSARQPGYYTMRNRTIEFELTVYDPDAGMRLTVRSREHDRCFHGMEVLLGAPDTQWEVDRYLWEHRPKEKKKKK